MACAVIKYYYYREFCFCFGWYSRVLSDVVGFGRILLYLMKFLDLLCLERLQQRADRPFPFRFRDGVTLFGRGALEDGREWHGGKKGAKR